MLIAAPGEPCLVLGDMAELGESAETLHFEAGEHAKQMGVKKLYAMGEASRHAVKGFGQGGEFFPNRQALIEAVRADLNASTVVLVKGSRAMAMENVVCALRLDKKNNNKQRAS